MLTTVTSFAIAGANFVKKEIEEYSQKISKRIIKQDEIKQNELFSGPLSDGLLSNYPEILNEKDKFYNLLKKINADLPKNLSKRFARIYKKIRFFSFIFSIHSSIMILIAALLQSHVLTNTDLIVYTSFSMIFFIFLPLFYRLFRINPIKKYSIATITFFISFILILFKLEDFIFSLFLVGMTLGYLNYKYKEYSNFEYLCTTIVYSLVLHLLIFNQLIDFRSFSVTLFYYLQMPLDSTLICLIVFIFIYFVTTLFVPVLCFYKRGKQIIKQHKKHREKIWEKNNSLKLELFEKYVPIIEQIYNDMGDTLYESFYKINHEGMSQEDKTDLTKEISGIMVQLDDKKLI